MSNVLHKIKKPLSFCKLLLSLLLVVQNVTMSWVNISFAEDSTSGQSSGVETIVEPTTPVEPAAVVEPVVEPTTPVDSTPHQIIDNQETNTDSNQVSSPITSI